MLSLPGQPRAGDWTHSLPAIQGRVAQNAELDAPLLDEWKRCKETDDLVFPFGKEMKNETLGVVAGEICMKRRVKRSHDIVSKVTQRNPKRQKNLPSTLVKCFSNLNGMPIPISKAGWNALSRQERRELIQTFYQPAGVVGTTAEYTDAMMSTTGGQNGRMDFANQIGGIYGIINTSATKSIYAGQLVVAVPPDEALEPTTVSRADLVRDRIQGTDPAKVLLETQPYDASNIISYDSFRAMTERINNVPNEGRTNIWPKPHDDVMSEVFVTRTLMEDFILLYAHITAVNQAVDNAGVVNAGTYRDSFNSIILGNGAAPAIERMKYVFNPSLGGISNDLDPLWKPKARQLIPKILNDYAIINRNYNRNVIGIALSDAAPGEQFDIKQSNFCT